LRLSAGWPDFRLLCRSSPVGDVRRDLIGAWQRPQQAVSAGGPPIEVEVDEVMIVLGADAHKRSHTIVALSAMTGEFVGEQTVQVGARGFAALLTWARSLDGERVWALEDCRHVSGSLERFLIGRGERVLRVATKLMAASRRGVRGRGKSDSIDAISVARAALREGLDALPAAQLEGPELDLRLVVDHRERLVRQRVALNNTLQWHLHDLWPELELPGSSLFYGTWAPRVARRLARAEQTMRVRVARDEVRRIRELSQTIKALERDIAQLVAQIAPQLLRARLRALDGGQARRRDRRRRPLLLRCQARPGRWRGADSRQLRQDQPTPPGPRRQPPDQRRHPPRRRHPRPLPPRDPGLPRAQTLRRQEHQGSHPLPQTPSCPPDLASTPGRPARFRTPTPINFLT
jgi:transposase